VQRAYDGAGLGRAEGPTACHDRLGGGGGWGRGRKAGHDTVEVARGLGL